MQDCNYCHHLNLTEKEQNIMKSNGLVAPLHMFNVQELETAPEWDGHTPTQAIERISSINGYI